MDTKTNKNRNIWIAVAIVGALCLVACGVAFLVLRQVGTKVTDSIKTDPADTQAVSDKIAQFDMPPGYKAQMAMSIIVYDLVAIAPSQTDSNGMFIMMMQFSSSANLDQAQMEEQMRQAFEQQGGQPGAQMKVVETREETIRGEQVTVTISEDGSQGATLRQWVTVFKGNGGPTVLMIQGATSDWNDELIVNFIHSIR
jgi:hypothetical protein